MPYRHHQPVMLEEALVCLQPKSNGFYIDATVGLGGHAEAILEASAPDGRLLGIDQDPEAAFAAGRRLARFGKRVVLEHANFADLARMELPKADGILMDLGVSSAQLEDSGRGFSFQRGEPLDMRMNPETSITAADVLNTYSQKRLEQIFREFGGDRRSKQIANTVAKQRRMEPFETTGQLVKAVGSRGAGGRIHPATRVFQALRIAVNHELDKLREGLDAAIPALNAGGTLCVLSFHSLEDRLVKWRFRNEARRNPAYEILRKKPATPTDNELRMNPRSRSAKLRALRFAPY